ncbi:hypothetical protein niasHT_015216 [Heterodera trifolii]|uniref:Uncharacterized protein n=1 Tax=Heterodera trifolii TaxID=157864 RepID=A0ABD2L2C4_9BILA
MDPWTSAARLSPAFRFPPPEVTNMFDFTKKFGALYFPNQTLFNEVPYDPQILSEFNEWRRNFLQQNIEHPDPTPPNDEIDIKQEPEDEELSDQMDFDPGPPALLAPQPNGMIGLHPPPLWPMEFPQPPPFPQPMGFLPPMGIPPPMQFVPLFANPPPPIPYPPARNPYPPQPLPQPVPMHPHPRPLFGAFPAPPLNPNPHGYAPIAPHGQNGAFRQQIGHQPRWRDRFRPPTPGVELRVPNRQNRRRELLEIVPEEFVVRLPPPPEPPNLRRWHDRHDEPPPPGVGA